MWWETPTYDSSHSGTGSQSFHVMAQERDDHAHPEQVLIETWRSGTQKWDKGCPADIITTLDTRQESQRLMRNTVWATGHLYSSCLSALLSSGAWSAQLFIEVTQHFIQCSAISNCTNCLTWGCITAALKRDRGAAPGATLYSITDVYANVLKVRKSALQCVLLTAELNHAQGLSEQPAEPLSRLPSTLTIQLKWIIKSTQTHQLYLYEQINTFTFFKLLLDQAFLCTCRYFILALGQNKNSYHWPWKLHLYSNL